MSLCENSAAKLGDDVLHSFHGSRLVAHGIAIDALHETRKDVPCSDLDKSIETVRPEFADDLRPQDRSVHLANQSFAHVARLVNPGGIDVAIEGHRQLLKVELAQSRRKTLKDVTELERKKAVELDKEQGQLIRDYAKKSGKLQIFDLTPQQMKVLQDAMKPVHDKFADIVPTKWIEEIKKMK